LDPEYNFDVTAFQKYNSLLVAISQKFSFPTIKAIEDSDDPFKVLGLSGKKPDSDYVQEIHKIITDFLRPDNNNDKSGAVQKKAAELLDKVEMAYNRIRLFN
jgi:hypothetical protein